MASKLVSLQSNSPRHLYLQPRPHSGYSSDLSPPAVLDKADIRCGGKVRALAHPTQRHLELRAARIGCNAMSAFGGKADMPPFSTTSGPLPSTSTFRPLA